MPKKIKRKRGKGEGVEVKQREVLRGMLREKEEEERKRTARR